MMKILCQLFLLLVISCSGGDSEEAAVENFTSTVEAAITAMGGVSDEQTAEGFTYSEPNFIDKMLEIMNPIQNAYAAVCSRAFYETCTGSQERIATYSSCTIGTTGQRLSGTVSLEYSEADCLINSAGETVTRTYNLTRTGYFGSVAINSANHQDYRGTTIGGGATLTYLGGNDYNLTINGKRKVRTRADGTNGFDISVRTTANIGVSGGLSRNNRELDGGRLEVIHNRLRYVAELVPNNLSYTSSCCYPVAGTMDVTYTGSLSGTGTVTFTGCGSASVTYNGDVKPITFYSCE